MALGSSGSVIGSGMRNHWAGVTAYENSCGAEVGLRVQVFDDTGSRLAMSIFS